MIKKMTLLPVCMIACALFASTAVAQTDDWKECIYGSWKCDVEKTVEALTAAEIPVEQIDMMKSMLLPGLTMEFTKDGVMNMNMEMGGQTEEKTASFEVTESDDEKKMLTLKVAMEEDPEDEKTGEVTILGDDSMQLVTDDGMTMVFARAKKDDDEAKK